MRRSRPLVMSAKGSSHDLPCRHRHECAGLGYNPLTSVSVSTPARVNLYRVRDGLLGDDDEIAAAACAGDFPA